MARLQKQTASLAARRSAEQESMHASFFPRTLARKSLVMRMAETHSPARSPSPERESPVTEKQEGVVTIKSLDDLRKVIAT